MEVTDPAALESVVRQFCPDGEFSGIALFGTGLIHRSFSVTVRRPSDPSDVSQFVLQRINTHVFPHPIALMENIDRVTAHLSHIAAATRRCALQLVRAVDGRSWTVGPDGTYWRIYRYIDGTRTVDRIESAEQCFIVARAFGDFQQQLISLPPPRLHDTIPGFHDTPRRMAALDRAIQADAAGRVRHTGREIDFALRREPLAHVLLDAGMPE
ncbi:MAG TPA: mucin desulfatase, partial [Terracidiphilus sp.]|nr:mucin desulfatase [Terracidiphilus sp.]